MFLFSTTGGNSHSEDIYNLESGKMYKFNIRCKDLSGNANIDDFSITFSVAPETDDSGDTTPPTGNLKIVGNAMYTKLSNIFLQISGSDPSGVAKIKLSNLPNFATASESNFGTTKQWTLSNGDGVKTVYLWLQDGVGNWTPATSPITSEITLDTTPPPVPTNPVAEFTSNSEILIKWNSPTNEAEIEKYKVFRNGNEIISLTGTSFSDKNLTPLTTYSYQILAVDKAGNQSDKTEIITVTTPAGSDQSLGKFVRQGDLDLGSGFDGAFIFGDTIKYIPPPLSNATFTVDFSPLGLSKNAPANTEFSVSKKIDFKGSFKITATDTTGEKTVFDSQEIVFDNIQPYFEGDELKKPFLEFHKKSQVYGIGSAVVVRVPTDKHGDEIVFTADFSDIAGEDANFIRKTNGATFRLIETDIDNPAYSKPIEFFDNAGNRPGNESSEKFTNSFAVDLIRPLPTTTELLSITDGNSPASMGDTVQFSAPMDARATNGEIIKFSVDLSPIAGTSENFRKITNHKIVKIVAGTFSNEPFSPSVTMFDKAENKTSFFVSPIQVENKPPEFNQRCGGSIRVIDNDMPIDLNKNGKFEENEFVGNGIADISNGEPDQIIFKAPDNSIQGCDFAEFEADFSSIGLGTTGILPADGRSIPITVGTGSVDMMDFSVPIKIFDEFRNFKHFSSGTFAIDNDVINLNETVLETDAFFRVGNSDGEIFPGSKIRAVIRTAETDLKKITASIPGATEPVKMTSKYDYQGKKWEAFLKIQPGPHVREWLMVKYTLLDDAGNETVVEGGVKFLITNDTTERGGGSGGTRNLHRKKWRSRLIKKYEEERNRKDFERLERGSERNTSHLPRFQEDELQNEKQFFEKFRELFIRPRPGRRMQILPKKTPKLELSIQRTQFPKIQDWQWKKSRNEQKEFRVRTTLENLKKMQKLESPTRTLGSLRTTELEHRKKFNSIRFSRKKSGVWMKK